MAQWPYATLHPLWRLDRILMLIELAHTHIHTHTPIIASYCQSLLYGLIPILLMKQFN